MEDSWADCEPFAQLARAQGRESSLEHEAQGAIPVRVMLMTTEFGIGGVQMKILGLAERLDKRAFEVHVVTNGRGNLMGRLRALPDVTLHELPVLTRHVSALNDLHALIAIVRLLRRVRPEVCEYTGPKMALLGGLAAWLVRVPCRVYTAAGITFNHLQPAWKRRFWLGIEFLLARLSTLVVFVCNENRDKVLRHRLLRREKSVVVHSGYDLNSFLDARTMDRGRLRTEYGWQDEDFVVLQVNSLIPGKNPRALVQIAELVCGRDARVRFVIAGEGPERTALEDLIKAKGLEGSVELLGARQDVARLMRAADVVTLTTLYAEGLPQVCSQAMAAGRPMVMYDWEGIREELSDGENGYLVPANDIHGFAARLIEIAGDPDRVARMGERSHALLNRAHDLNVYVDRMAAIYLSLGRRPSARSLRAMRPRKPGIEGRRAGFAGKHDTAE